jgi:hypothetical protein
MKKSKMWTLAMALAASISGTMYEDDLDSYEFEEEHVERIEPKSTRDLFCSNPKPVDYKQHYD